jgi:hypothetical protein
MFFRESGNCAMTHGVEKPEEVEASCGVGRHVHVSIYGK